MKRHLAIISLLLTGLCLGSCYRDDPDPGFPPANCFHDPSTLDRTYAYAMDSTDFYLFENYDSYYNLRYRESQGAKEVFDSMHITHRPMTYHDMRIFVKQGLRKTYTEDISDEYQKWAVANSEKLCLTKEEEEKLMQTVWKQKGLTYVVNNPSFVTSMLRGGTSITANRELFGLPAGTDIGSHFMVRGVNFCMPQGSISDYKFRFWYDEAPVAMSVPDYFATGTWLQLSYVFWLKDIPEEVYDEVTFTVTIPVINEYWKKYFCDALPEVPTLERALSASCTFHFGQLSDFEANYSRYKAENDQLEWKR